MLWNATFPTPADPRELLAITTRIIDAAWTTQIGLFTKPDGDLADRDALIEAIERRFRDNQTVDFFEFSRGHLKVRSQIAYWNAGAIAETVVGDLKQLLLTVQPDVDEHWLPHHGREPLTIYGHRVEYGSDAARFAAKNAPTILLNMDTTSDIWLPWVPWFGSKSFFDNRALAARHSPRLNAFLKTLVSLGATVTFTNMLGEAWVDAMADSEGIRLIDEPPQR